MALAHALMEISESYRNGKLVATGYGITITEGNGQSGYGIRFKRLRHSHHGVRYGWAATYEEALAMARAFHKRNAALLIEQWSDHPEKIS
jgi:hypothetical protein